MKTKLIIRNCNVYHVPTFRSDLAKLLFFHICSNANVYEAGIDDKKQIYFAYMNGIVKRYSRKDFLRTSKDAYVLVSFYLKNENGNPAHLGPDVLNHISYSEITDKARDKFDMETGYVFVENCGHWTGMNWTGKRFLIHRDFVDDIESNSYQSVVK